MESLLGLLPMLLLVAVMVWMIVSQRRRQAEVARMQSSLVVGEEILTVGGLIGRVTSADGPVIGLEVAPGVIVRVDRRTVSGRTADVPHHAAAAGTTQTFTVGDVRSTTTDAGPGADTTGRE